MVLWYFSPAIKGIVKMSLQQRYKNTPAKTAATLNGAPRLLTLQGAAEYLGVKIWTLRMMVRNREIPYVTIGKRRGYQVDRIDLDRYIERNKIPAVVT